MSTSKQLVLPCFNTAKFMLVYKCNLDYNILYTEEYQLTSSGKWVFDNTECNGDKPVIVKITPLTLQEAWEAGCCQNLLEELAIASRHNSEYIWITIIRD